VFRNLIEAASNTVRTDDTFLTSGKRLRILQLR